MRKAYSLGCGMELTPDPDRRLTLTGEKDALGLPRLKLDMRIADDDFDRLPPHPDASWDGSFWPAAPACCASTAEPRGLVEDDGLGPSPSGHHPHAS